MGIFKRKKQLLIFSPVSGEIIPITQVKDEVFSREILGRGVAIIPSEGRIIAPCDATVDMIFDTSHAVNLVTEQGVEILIHIGIDTVNLRGEHFKPCVKNGDKVKVGDTLINFEPDGIKGAGYDIVTPIVICNPSNFDKMCITEKGIADHGDVLITLEE